MKGYTFPVKNDLLDPKHYEIMGKSIWLYLWFLDKMTSIDSDQVGKILGGKPVSHKEVHDELGISVREYRRFVKTLRSNGYINTLRTPYGLVITLNKASKFKRSAGNAPPQKHRDVPKSKRDVPKNERDVPKTHQTNKRIQDSTIDITKTQGEIPEINQPDSLTSNQIKPSSRRRDKSSPDINGVLAAFEEALGLKLRRRENQRRMANNLIREYGVDDVLGAIKAVKMIKDERYAPQILDLQDLWEKWDKLAAFFRRKKVDLEKSVAVITEEDDE